MFCEVLLVYVVQDKKVGLLLFNFYTYIFGSDFFISLLYLGCNLFTKVAVVLNLFYKREYIFAVGLIVLNQASSRTL